MQTVFQKLPHEPRRAGNGAKRINDKLRVHSLRVMRGHMPQKRDKILLQHAKAGRSAKRGSKLIYLFSLLFFDA